MDWWWGAEKEQLSPFHLPTKEHTQAHIQKQHLNCWSVNLDRSGNTFVLVYSYVCVWNRGKSLCMCISKHVSSYLPNTGVKDWPAFLDDSVLLKLELTLFLLARSADYQYRPKPPSEFKWGIVGIQLGLPHKTQWFEPSVEQTPNRLAFSQLNLCAFIF